MARGRIFSDYEIAYIKANYTSKTRHDVARFLQRDVNSISAVASTYGLTTPRKSAKRQLSKSHNGAITAHGPAIEPSRSDATYEEGIRSATRQLGAAVDALIAKMERRA